MPLCLEGTFVLDLTRRYPGAFAAMLLADFGADVIKVDPPVASGVTPQGDDEETFAAYTAVDRNKRSITLDLKKSEAKDILKRLAVRADVLVEGFRPGVMDRLGVGYTALATLNPRLIYCSLSGFGQDGPYAKIPAHDMNYIGIAGALSLIGERDGQPYLPSNIIADYAGAALHGAVGVLLALLARQKTGRGQFVDIAYLDAVVSLITPSICEYFYTGVAPVRGKHAFTGGLPWAQVFRCKDGKYFTIGAAEQHLWANLCRAIGRQNLIPYKDAGGERGEEVISELSEVFATRGRDEWYAYLIDKEACIGPVNTIDEAVKDPQVLHREMVVELNHPKLGKVKQPGVAIKLSDTPATIRRLGVPTGSDSEAVLAELGYSGAEIAALREAGALG